MWGMSIEKSVIFNQKLQEFYSIFTIGAIGENSDVTGGAIVVLFREPVVICELDSTRISLAFPTVCGVEQMVRIAL